ncbi:uncharacterized protein LOC132697179 [Cylas formicarius]|uniref:uncharacterized protein LOC132697179 n=1 Tax=Cylas formicarius TaxID=197179 RepID=UPI00295857AC|nr:uncharacterized protein LOC132697179 [Cylas formicarius]
MPNTRVYVATSGFSVVHFCRGESLDLGLYWIVQAGPLNSLYTLSQIRDRWYNYTLISTHAPTEDKDEEVKDEYYEQLEQTISAVPKQDMLIILGDLNAKVGREEAFRPHIGRHSLHELSNDNGQRLINLAAANNLRIASTMFPHKNIHKETWISNDRKTRNQIDHVIANARHVRSIIDVKSQRGADAGTDHFLVRVKVRSRIKKTITSQETSALKRWNTDKLNQDETCRHEYQKELETQLQKNVTQEASDVEEHWKQIRTSVINAAQRALGENTKNRRRKDWYDEESQKALDTKNKARIQMLQCPSDGNVQRFNDLRVEAKRKIRRKKREAYNKTIENVEKEAGLTNSRNFFNQNNKAPGEDSITAECIKYGGEHLDTAILELLKNIWKTEALPKEWNEGTIVPIHKKGDRMACKNYRGITLLNITYKVLSNVLRGRISPYAEDNLGDYQCGFRPKRSTTDQIFTIRQLLEKSWEFKREVHQLFVDFRQAYDSITRESVWQALEGIGVPKKIIRLTKICIENSKAKVRVGKNNTEAFSINNGLKQGDGLSPLLFNIVLDMAIKEANIGLEIFTNKGPEMILAYADDIDTVESSTIKTIEMFMNIEKETKKVGLMINEDKTKYMWAGRRAGRGRIGQNITMDTHNFECVNQFQYLGAVITSDDDITSEIKARIQKGNKCFFALQNLFKSRLISRNSKLRIYSAVIKPIVMYGSETWTMTKQNELVLRRFERRMLRKIFGPTIDERTGQYRIRTNAELNDMYKRPSLVNEIKAQRLRIWEENPAGKRPLGRPRLRWRDNIEEDVKILGVRNWKEVVLDRDRWRRVVDAAKTHEGL